MTKLNDDLLIMEKDSINQAIKILNNDYSDDEAFELVEYFSKNCKDSTELHCKNNWDSNIKHKDMCSKNCTYWNKCVQNKNNRSSTNLYYSLCEIWKIIALKKFKINQKLKLSSKDRDKIDIILKKLMKNINKWRV